VSPGCRTDLDGYYPLKAKVMEMKRRDFILTADAHDWLILHGRYTCLARKPRCEVCLINDLCRWPKKTV
jgi:endonuclease III